MDASLPSHDAWTRARDRFIEDLSEHERHIYYKASLETIYYDASASEKLHAESSTTRNIISKIQPLVEAVDQYSEALNVYANTYPLITSPLWGSIRVLLHVTSKFSLCKMSEDNVSSLQEHSASIMRSLLTCWLGLATSFLVLEFMRPSSPVTSV